MVKQAVEIQWLSMMIVPRQRLPGKGFGHHRPHLF